MDQPVDQVLDPLRPHRPIFTPFTCAVGQTLEGHTHRHVGVGLKARQGAVGNSCTVRLLVGEREGRDGDDDGACAAGLTRKFRRSTASCATSKAGQKDHQFGAFEHRASHRVETAHALFRKGRQGRTSLRFQRVAKPEHVAFGSNAKASVVGVNRQEARGRTATMCRRGPRTTEASDPSDDDLTAVHERA